MPYLESAGTERHALKLSETLLAHGHQVMLLAPEGPLSGEFAGLGIKHIQFPRFQGHPKPALRGIEVGVRHAMHWGTNVIHTHAGVEVLYGVHRVLKHISQHVRPAIVFTIHSYFGKYPQLDYFLAATLSRRWADHVIAVSHADGQTLCRYQRQLSDMLSVVHNGMPFDERVSSEEGFAGRRYFIDKYDAGPRAAVCLVVGRLAPQKGIDVLLEALSQYQGQEVLVLIAGGGELGEELRAQSAALGLDKPAGSSQGAKARVVFLGPRDDIPRLLAAADLFVLPSRMEGLSLALIEAHAAGVPCLVTDVGGNSEIVVHNHTGCVIPSENPVALAKALGEMVDNREGLQTMAAAARERYEEHFTAERMTHETLSIYKAIIGGKFDIGASQASHDSSNPGQDA